MKQKQKYEAPGLTVVQFKAELGFATSGVFAATQQLDALIEDEITRANAAGGIGNEFAAGYFDNEDMTNPTGSWVYDNGGGAGGSWF